MAPVQGFVDEKLMEWDGWVGGAGAYHYQPENNTTSWPNLKVETFQIFSWADILSWAECGNNPKNQVNGSWGDTHLLFGGRSAPPKRKYDRPKNLEVFLVNFQILDGAKNYYILGP